MTKTVLTKFRLRVYESFSSAVNWLVKTFQKATRIPCELKRMEKNCENSLVSAKGEKIVRTSCFELLFVTVRSDET